MPDIRNNKISCHNYQCEIEVVLEVISGKWTALILWNLGNEGVLRFSELQKRMDGVTQKMLTQQLRMLEQNEIIKRKVYPEVPPVVEYSLTKLGQGLIPILEQMDEWGKVFVKRRLKD